MLTMLVFINDTVTYLSRYLLLFIVPNLEEAGVTPDSYPWPAVNKHKGQVSCLGQHVYRCMHNYTTTDVAL